MDTSVFLDLAGDDASWADWPGAQLNDRAAASLLVINDVVYAEISLGFDRIEELDIFLAEAGLEVERTPRPGLFLAARAHLRYRRRGGTRLGVLPDFFIGAHAALGASRC